MGVKHPTAIPTQLKRGSEPLQPEEAAKIIGLDYVESDTLPGEDQLDSTYQHIASVNRERFESIPVEVVFQSEDPYPDAAAMFADIEDNGRLKVFDGGTHPNAIARADNITGRAVHDYYSHYLHRLPFTFIGEFRVWQHEYPHYLVDFGTGTKLLLFTDIVAQNAAAHYLPDGFDSDRFSQREAYAKDWWIGLAQDVIGRGVNE